MLAPALVSTLVSQVLCLASARLSQEEGPTISVEAATYLAEALATMREASFHRNHLDWSAIRRAAFANAAGAEVPVDTYAAVRGALLALGDRHSFLQLPAELARLEDDRRAARGIHMQTPVEIPASPESIFALRRKAEGHVHETNAGPIARVVVPFFMGAEVNGFAREIQDILVELNGHRPRGWIVDLRGNGGGNMWPMLAGIGPVLGEGRIGAFLGVEGVREHWYYRAGKAGAEKDGGADGWVGAEVDRPHSLTVAPPVAVLIDGGTASSGEAVAIAFKGRPATRFFGRPTHGLSSSNQGFRLSDGANLVITVGLDVDRTGKEYPDVVLPDEDLQGPASTNDEDLQIAAALDWLIAEGR